VKKLPSDVSLDVVERRAFLGSSSSEFAPAVSSSWYDIWNLWSVSTIGFGSRTLRGWFRGDREDGGSKKCPNGQYMGPKGQC